MQDPRHSIDTAQREREFRQQFSGPTYSIPEDYFTPTGMRFTSQFDRDCCKILDAFSSFRSDNGVDRQSYLDTFHPQSWSKLAESKKAKHTLSNCDNCSTHLCSFISPSSRDTNLSKVSQLSRSNSGVRE